MLLLLLINHADSPGGAFFCANAAAFAVSIINSYFNAVYDCFWAVDPAELAFIA
jgi:hypothetical protein